MSQIFLRLAPLAGALALFLGLLPAQDPRGALRGRVIDQTGSVVPNVEVRITNVESGVTISARSNETGTYHIPFLLPGTYTAGAELDGFKKFLRSGVQIRVSETVELDIAMEVGAVAETVEVKAEPPLLDTAGASTAAWPWTMSWC
jgi:hypothetical protein